MEKEVFYLESDEEITGVVDRIKSNPAKKIFLVAPRMTALIQSVVNLKLLKNEAESSNKEIALVTQDSVGRNLAAQVGLPVYENVDDLRPIIQRSSSMPRTDEIIEIDLTKPKDVPSGIKVHHFQQIKPTEKKEMKMPKVNEGIKKPRNWKIFVVSSIAVLVGLAFLAIFLPKVTITLAVKGEPFEKSVTVGIDTAISKSVVSPAQIPGRQLDVLQESQKEYDATGTKDIGQKATGDVTLYNETGVAQGVASGTTLVASGGLKFITRESVEIPAGKLDAGGDIIAGSVKVRIEAELAGDKYNLGASNYSVSGFSSKVNGRGSGMSGGSTKQVKVVSQQDLDNAKNSLHDELLNLAKKQLNDKKGKDMIMEGALSDEIVDSSANKKVGDEMDKFKYFMKIKIVTIGFSQVDFKQVLIENLRKDIPENKDIILSSNDKIETTLFEQNIAQGKINISGKLITKLVPKIQYDSIKKEIRGRTKARATQIFANSSGEINQIEIKTNPSWWKLMPVLEKKIEINFNYL